MIDILKELKKDAYKGNARVQTLLGFLYYIGIEGKRNLNGTVKLYTMAAKQGYSEAQRSLGDLYLKGIGVKQNFKKAEELFRKALNNGNLDCKYYVQIFDQLQGRKIQVVRDMSEEVEEDVGAVLILPKENISEFAHTLYDINTYRKIKSKINEILEGIEEVKPDKSNEFDVFMKIYTRLGQLILYDNTVKYKILKSIKRYTSRNLVGGLLQGKCVCARICRDIKKCTSL